MKATKQGIPNHQGSPGERSYRALEESIFANPCRTICDTLFPGMVPPRDIEELRTLLEVNYIQQARVKLNLATILLELSGAEYANGEMAAGEKHLLAARTAVYAARSIQ